MANKVNNMPSLARPGGATSVHSLNRFDIDLMRTLLVELAAHAQRINLALVVDGTEGMTGPLPLKSYTVAGVPAAGSYTGAMIYVSNEAGGAVPAFSDGVNWRRVTDRAVIS